MSWLRSSLKDILPPSALNWLRRWVLTGRYVRSLSHELYARRKGVESGQLEDLEARLVGPGGGLYRQMVREVVERSDLLMKQLDRKLEGQGARHGERLAALEAEVAGLRESVDRLAEVLGLPGRPSAGSGSGERTAPGTLADAASE
jgi:hypothetical protein